jgi:hypothetical protein
MKVKLGAFILLVLVSAAGAQVSAKTVYVDLLSADTRAADGTYDRPFKSWREGLQHVTSGDTLVAKNGDYRKAGAHARWGGLHLTLTLDDELQKEDPHPPKGCRHSVRLTQSENLALKNNIFILSGVVDETMLYQVTGEGVKVSNFDDCENTFFNNGHDIPVGGLADPNQELGFSKADPKLAGVTGTNYWTWMATAQSQIKGRGVSLDLSKSNER